MALAQGPARLAAFAWTRFAAFVFRPELDCRRVQHFKFTAETQLDFSPENFMQSAGLNLLLDTRTHFYLRVTRDEQLGKSLASR